MIGKEVSLQLRVKDDPEYSLLMDYGKAGNARLSAQGIAATSPCHPHYVVHQVLMLDVPGMNAAFHCMPCSVIFPCSCSALQERHPVMSVACRCTLASQQFKPICTTLSAPFTADNVKKHLMEDLVVPAGLTESKMETDEEFDEMWCAPKPRKTPTHMWGGKHQVDAAWKTQTGKAAHTGVSSHGILQV